MKGLLVLLVWAALSLAGCARVSGAGGGVDEAPVVPSDDARRLITTLVLTDEGPAPGQGRAVFQARSAGQVGVAFSVLSRGGMAVRATCDGPARALLHPFDADAPAQIVPGWVPAGTPVVVRLGAGARQGPMLDLNPEVTRCALQVAPDGRAPWSLDLQRADHALPALARWEAGVQSCSVDPGADPLARVFAAVDAPGLAVSCPMPVGPTTMLAEGVDALNARIEALTGRAVDAALLLAGDPQMPLDWSDAPRLDLIYVTTLNLNADLAGYLTARMLAWHAARGTPVRILLSDVMLTDNDRALVEGLAARYPMIQVQSYRLPTGAGHGVEGQFARVHAVNHVKLFAALSSQPGRSRAIIGGRNLHEGYFFDTPRDLSALPFLHQYDPSQTRLTGGFTAYDDAEVLFSGDAAVAGIMRHMGLLWDRDFDTQAPLRPEGARDVAATTGSMRHFLSVPVADAQAQEALFVAMIDAAERRIRIASPYLTLTPPLAAALERARARGVTVDVVLTVRVREALDFAVTGFNRRFINQFGDWIRVYDHDLFPALLHAKLYVVDDRLVVVTSTNLNARSFVHDMENGVIALDSTFAAQVDAQIQSYIDAGVRVHPVQPVPRALRWMERIRLVERWF